MFRTSTAAPGTAPSNRTLGEQCHDAMLLSAQSESDARRAKKLAERVLAQITLAMDGKSHAERETKARCEMKYIAAEDAYLEAETRANVQKAEADGLRIRFEEWRTNQATTRAEMNLR